jgi:hypothetical protein
MDAEAERELAGFVEKFAPEMQDRIRGCRERLAARYPRAVQLVYDNYNFLVVGFGPTQRPSQSLFSLAAHRRGVNLCFLQRAPELPDPTSILRGQGSTVRNVALAEPEDLDRPDVVALLEAQAALAVVPMEESEGPLLVIRSVSAKQRPRR